MGALLGFVAAPCVGPVVAPILALVATRGEIATGFWGLASFGLGLGILFLVLGVSSGSISRLPRSGMWMVEVKKVSGFIMLAVALYFASLKLPVLATGLLASLLAMGFGVYAGAFTPLAREDGFFRKLGKTLGIFSALLGAYLFLGVLQLKGFILSPLAFGPVSQQTEALEQKWFNNFEEGIAEAKNLQKPVFIDFWATWCIPCKELEANEFQDAEVKQELKRFVLIKQDITNASGPEAERKTKTYKSFGVPFLVGLSAEQVGKDPNVPTLRHEGKPSKAELLEFLRQLK
jgi:thiol:disulfide interchange protein DsbD